MRIALREGRRGLGRTRPNPPVGVAIVRDDRVIATGFHARAGGPHAEQVALAEAGDAARNAEVFVTLEPCSHTGRTRPCAKSLIAAGVKRVIAGVVDPNPKVSGRGLATLEAAGIEVRTGVLEAECRELNAAFFTFIQKGRPLVTAKFASTLDGKIATRSGDSKWISNSQSRLHAHRLRDSHDAVLVGTGTLRHDNPSLTTRGLINGRDAIRIVLDARGQIPADAQLITQKSDAPTWVFCGSDAAVQVRARLSDRDLVIPVELDANGRVSVLDVLEELSRREIMSLLVEGGGETLASFFEAQRVDRVVAFIAPRICGGRNAPTPVGGTGVAGPEQRMFDTAQLTRVQVERCGDDIMISGDVSPPSLAGG